MIQNKFITNNLKIKGSIPYPTLLIEASVSPIECTTMFRYMMYKKKLYNMEAKRLPKITSNSSKNHLRLKQGWHKDAKSWLDHWDKREEFLLGNTYNIKNIIINLRISCGVIRR